MPDKVDFQRQPKMSQKSMKIRKSGGGTVHFYPESGSAQNGRVQLVGHYKCPKTKGYKKTTRFVTAKTARRLGFGI